MKTKLLWLLLATLSLLSCDNNDPIWDMKPVEIEVYVQDEEGNDLLNRQTPSNVVSGKEIVAIYDDKKYKYGEEILNEKYQTKYYMPRMFGFVERKYSDKFCMYFGEIDGANNYHNQTLTIEWGDGTKDVISFNRTVDFGRKSCDVHQQFFLNGKETRLPIIITK